MLLVNIANSQRVKTHDLHNYEKGIDYFIDFFESGKFAILTIPLAMQPEDRVILSEGEQVTMYWVKQCEEYWNDHSIKTNLLIKM